MEKQYKSTQRVRHALYVEKWQRRDINVLTTYAVGPFESPYMTCIRKCSIEMTVLKYYFILAWQ